MPRTIANNKRHRFWFVLFVTFLAFSLPEVFAGSGRDWPARPDVYILALPLYGLHFFLLTHIAARTKRTSWPALYLFGLIFALYESWITKVIWSGYPGSIDFALGGFGPWVGIHESLGLTLFFHPITSFLLPLAIVSRLFPVFGQHFPTPDWVFGATRWAKVRRVVLLLVWGLISGHNMPVIGSYLFSWLPALLLLWLGYKYLKPHSTAEITGPFLTRRGVVIASIWLALIYVVSYFLLLPDRLPPPAVQLITFLIYPVLILLIKRTPKREVEPTTETPQNPARMPANLVLSVFFIGLATTFVIAVNGTAGMVLGAVSILAMIPLGVGLFIRLALIGGFARR